jgi:hypothetical protein
MSSLRVLLLFTGVSSNIRLWHIQGNHLTLPLRIKDDILLFFKLYDPNKEELRLFLSLTWNIIVLCVIIWQLWAWWDIIPMIINRYVGSLFLKASSKPSEVYSPARLESTPLSGGGGGLDMLNCALQKVHFPPYCCPLEWILWLIQWQISYPFVCFNYVYAW